MEKNIDKVKGLLQTVKEQFDKLLPLASDTQKAAMEKVDGWISDINAFKDKVGRGVRLYLYHSRVLCR